MAAVRSILAPPPVSQRGIPPLVAGDRLTRAEFERRYQAMPEVKRAELIEGIVYMPSPVRITHHARQHIVLGMWLAYYFTRTPGLEDVGDNATVRLDGDNEVQPDVCLLRPAAAGGLARVDEDGYIVGPPALVGEVSGSTVSMDLHQKLNVYRASGVQEYLVWRVDDAAIDWLALRDGRYEPLTPDAEGLVRSEVFPGLWLNVPALLSGDLARVLADLDRGVADSSHAEFVRRLAR
jgi:Uma2 family endonuclease